MAGTVAPGRPGSGPAVRPGSRPGSRPGQRSVGFRGSRPTGSAAGAPETTWKAHQSSAASREELSEGVVRVMAQTVAAGRPKNLPTCPKPRSTGVPEREMRLWCAFHVVSGAHSVRRWRAPVGAPEVHGTYEEDGDAVQTRYHSGAPEWSPGAPDGWAPVPHQRAHQSMSCAQIRAPACGEGSTQALSVHAQ